MFFEDRILGKGIMTLPDDSTYVPQSLIHFIQALFFSRLEGVFNDGRLNDDGTYSGFNGTGTRKFVNGDIFVGMYVNGIEYGKGVYTYSDGETHEGSSVDNNRHDQKTNIFW